MLFPFFSRNTLNLSKLNLNSVYSAHEEGLNVLSLVSLKSFSKEKVIHWKAFDHSIKNYHQMVSRFFQQ